VFQDIEPEAEAYLVVSGLKLRGVANACNGHAADNDRVIDDIRENRVFAGRRENARGEDGARRVLRTRNAKRSVTSAAGSPIERGPSIIRSVMISSTTSNASPMLQAAGQIRHVVRNER
jgi:hypothetical protein